MLHRCLEAPPETERVWGGLCNLMSYFCSYMALCSSLPPRGMIFHEGLRNSCNAIEYGDLRDNGMMEKIRFTRHMGVMPRNVDFKNVIEKMLVYIAI